MASLPRLSGGSNRRVVGVPQQQCGEAMWMQYSMRCPELTTGLENFAVVLGRTEPHVCCRAMQERAEQLHAVRSVHTPSAVPA
jgi:hypothetical protein